MESRFTFSGLVLGVAMRSGLAHRYRRRTMFRPLGALGLAAGALLLVAGCAGAQQARGSAGPATPTITSPSGAELPGRADADLVIWAHSNRVAALRDIAETFGGQRGVSVAVQAVDEDLQVGFIAANGAGLGPDVVVGPHDWIGRLVQNSAIEPVQLSEADQQRYVPIARQAVTYKQRIYGLPYAFESVALFRNTALVDEAPSSIEQLAVLAEEAGAEHPLCLPIGDLGDAYHLGPLYSSAGGYVFGRTATGEYDVADLGVGKEGSLTAAAKLGQLGHGGVLRTEVDARNAVPLFTEGSCAFLEAGPSALAELRESGVEYAITPMVGFSGMQPARPFTGVHAFFVATKGQGRDLAQQFVLDAVNSPDAMTTLYEAEPRPPAMTDVLDAVSSSDPDTAAFATAATAGLVLPAVPQMAAVWEPLGRAEAAIVGGADPRTTMSTAGTTIADDIH